MGQALYRKYRSKQLSEIVGQEHITKTLAQAVKTNRISHAYLFTGPRGIGKTSVARILAHDINNLPYKDDSSHIDIIEIDAASNGRVDEIRDLRDMVYVAPVSAKYKVYIIDEVHMLSSGAFNALLKTLEEPPRHVVFILATTAAHKLPDTIISRTQHFQFKPISVEQITDHLKTIAQAENIQVDEAALRLIAEHGQGSFRDSISLLDQAANYAQPITANEINSLLGIPPDQLITLLVDDLSGSEPKKLINDLKTMMDQGYSPSIVAKRLSNQLRNQLIENTGVIDSNTILSLLEQLIIVPSSPEPQHYLEICLLRHLKVVAQVKPIQSEISHKARVVQELNTSTASQTPTKQRPVKPEKHQDVNRTIKSGNTAQLDEDSWIEVLDLLKKQYNTLYGIIRMAQVDFSDPDSVRLQFAFAFHQKRLNESKNRSIITEAIKQVINRDVVVECLVNPDLLHQKKVDQSAIANIANVFGGAEPL